MGLLTNKVVALGTALTLTGVGVSLLSYDKAEATNIGNKIETLESYGKGWADKYDGLSIEYNKLSGEKSDLETEKADLLTKLGSVATHLNTGLGVDTYTNESSTDDLINGIKALVDKKVGENQSANDQTLAETLGRIATTLGCDATEGAIIGEINNIDTKLAELESTVEGTIKDIVNQANAEIEQANTDMDNIATALDNAIQTVGNPNPNQGE